MFAIRLPLSVALLVAAAMLAACAGNAGSTLSFAPSTARSISRPETNPPSCKGQKNTKKYSSLSVTLSTSGGSFCIPEFGGFGGSVEYPGADPSVKVTLVSSTSDYAKLPQLGSGTAIFYLQLALSGGTHFSSNVKAGGGLTAKKIVAGKIYTAFGRAEIGTLYVDFTPCYAKATKGKYGGVIGGLGTLLKGQLIPAAASGFIEIYSGQQTSGQC
jgi:hypothetical protein